MSGSYTARPRVAAEAKKLRTDPLANPAIAVQAPQIIAARLWQEYATESTINRNINQIVEQVTGDATVRPRLDNEVIDQAFHAWWNRERMPLRVNSSFKEFLISGERWPYVPMRRSGRIPLRDLTPWNVTEITGRAWHDWDKATYRDREAEITLTPESTAFYAHDALFGNLRGLSPFCTMAFEARRYRAFLDGRERVNRTAGIVTGHLKFDNIEDAASVLGWKRDDQGNPKPEVVYLPEEGTVVVTIGEADFQLLTPSVNAAGADPDGQRFYLRMVEAGRLPEYASGNGANVNVATATVQYPFAVRFMLAARDEFEYSMNDALRIVLQRMQALNYIPQSWVATRSDGTTATESPETAEFTWTFPEVRELNWNDHFEAIMTLVQRNLLDDERAMELLGYDPDSDMPSPEERAARRQQASAFLQNIGGGSEEEGLRAIAQAVRAGMFSVLTSRGDANT